MLPSSSSTVLSPASFYPLLCLLWLKASFSHRYQMAANNSWGYIFSFMLRGRTHLPQPSNRSPKLSSRSVCVTCPFLSFDEALRYCRYAEASLVAEPAKNPLTMQGIQVPSLGWEVPWRRKWPLHSSCLGNAMDRGAWWATVHLVTKRQKGLSD